MDFFRSRAVPALALVSSALAFNAHADCSTIHGIYQDESVEKIDGSPRTLSSFASPKERSKLVKQESAGGPKPSFGGSGEVMQRPKVTKLVQTVEVRYAAELRLKFLDAEGKPLHEVMNVTPSRWKCVNDRLERKFQMGSGIGDIYRTEEVQQVMTAQPGGDLSLVESRKTIEGPKGPEVSREVHFKRVPKA